MYRTQQFSFGLDDILFALARGGPCKVRPRRVRQAAQVAAELDTVEEQLRSLRRQVMGA